MPLDSRQVLEADLGGPPVLAQIPEPLLRLGESEAIGAADDRQAAGQVEIFERGRILALPDVLGHDVDAVAEVVGKIGEHKAGVGRFEHKPRRQRIRDFDLGDPSIHVGGKGQLRGVCPEHVNGELEIVSGPRSPVAPLHSLANVDRRFRVVGVVLVAFGDPGYDVVLFYVRVVEVERLIQVVEARGLGADDKGIERVVVPHLRQTEDEGAVAGDVLYAPLVGATGTKSEAADEKPCGELCFVKNLPNHFL